MTPLDQFIRAQIKATGPMRLDTFMKVALSDPQHGYYTTRQPLGAPHERGGDFTTAPEISQMFGDMIGLWIVDLWQRMGSPKSLHLAELGPGRGTLARDINRILQKHAACDAIKTHLVEISPTLTQLQKTNCPNAEHHLSIESLPEDAPIIIFANEFFDALPIRQFKKHRIGWRECYVILESDGALSFQFLPSQDKPYAQAHGQQETHNQTNSNDDIVETCPGAQTIMGHLCERLNKQSGSFLTFDYGSGDHGTGDTLQAMRAHQYTSPLNDIGLCDLTSHVNFATLSAIAHKHGLRGGHTIKQGDFLQRIGINQRAQNLMSANPARIAQTQAERDRLIAPDQMGALFKAFAIASQNMPLLAGFETNHDTQSQT